MTEIQIAEDRDKMYCEIFKKILTDFYRTFRRIWEMSAKEQ